jgi:tRNA G46 methylase TrmB
MENGRYEIIFVALIQSTSYSYDVWMYISQQLDIICVKVVSISRTCMYVKQIQAVTIQFPDPHFKARHKKRRVVNPDLVNCLAKYLPAGTLVFLQSDIQELEVDMISHFQNVCMYVCINMTAWV